MSLLLALPAEAAGVSASAESVYPGEVLEVTLELPEEYEAFTGTVQYDGKLLELAGLEISPGWQIQFAGERFTLTRREPDAPVRLTVRFWVQDAPAGTELLCHFRDITGMAGQEAAELGSFTAGSRVREVPDGNHALAVLSAEGVTLSPAFHPEITAYTAQVDHSVSQLTLYAQAAGEEAAVQMDNPVLKPGEVTRLTVTVTAQNGNQRVYTLDVFRPLPPETEPTQKPSEPVPSQTTESTEETAIPSEPVFLGGSSEGGVSIWTVAAALLAGAALGAGGGILLNSRDKKKS